jgi:hypothetical protein
LLILVLFEVAEAAVLLLGLLMALVVLTQAPAAVTVGLAEYQVSKI